MKRQEYCSILEQLPIENPTPQDMAKLCPHLTEEEAVEAFTTDSGRVACPPLLIRYGFRIVSYHKEYVEELGVLRVNEDAKDTSVTGIQNHPAQLGRSYASRTPKSYVDGKSHGSIFLSYKHMDEAMKFAEDNWGKELILDDWDSVVEFYVQDPTDLVTDQNCEAYPHTKAVLYVALNRDIREITKNHSKPQSEMFDDVIAQMTVDHNIWDELKGDRAGSTKYNCAHCSAGLGLSSCAGCDYHFHDDCIRCGWDTPLSRKMVAFLRENGHEFKVDPEIAWKKERENWERGKLEEELSIT